MQIKGFSDSQRNTAGIEIIDKIYKMIFTVHAHNDEMNGVQEYTSLSNMLQSAPNVSARELQHQCCGYQVPPKKLKDREHSRKTITKRRNGEINQCLSS